MLINIAKIDKNCRVLGPGKRYIIWVQGCFFNCKGCYNVEYQFFEEKILVDIEEIIKDILSAKDKIEGVTFLGGEPLLQAKQLTKIAKKCQENELSVLCYTGFEYEDLKGMKNKNVEELFKYVDVLIDGLYVEELAINREFKGSSNQKIIYFTNRYKKKDFDVENLYEIEIDENNLHIKGFYK